MEMFHLFNPGPMDSESADEGCSKYNAKLLANEFSKINSGHKRHLIKRVQEYD